MSRILTKNGANTLLDLNYAYDPNGNILNVNTNQETYTYDDLNRLSTGNGPWGSLSYTYDIVGNRLSESVNGTSTPYTIGSYNKLSSAGTVSFTYDGNGNRITKTDGANSWSYSYDYENRMKQVTLNGQQVFRAWYDGDGRRIKTTDTSTTIVSDYLAGSWDPVYQKDLSAGVVTDFIFAGNLRIGKIQGNQPYYYHLDHLGSVRLTTDSSINQTFQTTYKPYGSQYATSGNPEKFTYTGKRLDNSTGLYYYGFRYYDPQVGRFITADKYPFMPMNPQRINQYSFVLNNPNTYTDQDGRTTTDDPNRKVEPDQYNTPVDPETRRRLEEYEYTHGGRNHFADKNYRELAWGEAKTWRADFVGMTGRLAYVYSVSFTVEDGTMSLSWTGPTKIFVMGPLYGNNYTFQYAEVIINIGSSNDSSDVYQFDQYFLGGQWDTHPRSAISVRRGVL